MGRHKRSQAEDGARVSKGCNCKRSACLKNYCDCYEAKMRCTSLCKCQGCRNGVDRPLDSNDVRTGEKVLGEMEQLQIGEEHISKMFEEELRALYGVNNNEDEHKKRSPFLPSDDPESPNALTSEAIEAVIDCLLTQAEECEKVHMNELNIERLVLLEFGKALECFLPIPDE